LHERLYQPYESIAASSVYAVGMLMNGHINQVVLVTTQMPMVVAVYIVYADKPQFKAQ
jgi:hypothetical protein